jgi:hypothetical protein
MFFDFDYLVFVQDSWFLKCFVMLKERQKIKSTAYEKYEGEIQTVS